jgi:UvrD-like helicase C-terminal domain/AAA domain
MTFTPTAEQEMARKLFASGEDLAIEAGAGTGKSSTLRLLAEDAQTEGRTGIYLAFNKALVVDASKTFPGNVTCSTAHSLAYRAHGFRFKARLNSGRMKSMDIARLLGLDGFTIRYGTQTKPMSAGYLAGLVMRTIANFCQTADTEPSASHVPYIDGIDVPTEGPNGIRRGYANNNEVRSYVMPYVRKAWADMCQVKGQLPYGHHCYLKAYELSHPHISTDFILFDEAQDVSLVLLSIVSRQTHAQIVWVGDSAQAIFEFTGAVDALARIKESGAQTSMLSQSFRFGHAVAEVANGILGRLDSTLILSGFGNISSVVGPVAEPTAILTRTNAESIKQMLTTLKAGRKPHLVGGGSEVAAFCRGAKDLMDRGWTSHPELACFQTWGEVQDYVISDEQGGELKLMVDLIDSFGVDVILDALNRATSETQADLVISTAHKAKGREWDSVQLAGDFFKPKNEGDDLPPAELRLLYVAVTRAKRELDVTAVPHALGLPKSGPDDDPEGGVTVPTPTPPTLGAPAATLSVVPVPEAPAAKIIPFPTKPALEATMGPLHTVTLHGVTHYSRFLGRCDECKTPARFEIPSSAPLFGRWVMQPPAHSCAACGAPVAVKAVCGKLTEGRCDPRCWNAYGSDCRCSCGGQWHGNGIGPTHGLAGVEA